MYVMPAIGLSPRARYYCTSRHDITNIFHDFKVMFIRLNEETNHTVRSAETFTCLFNYEYNLKCISAVKLRI